jgi:hypothetical protein
MWATRRAGVFALAVAVLLALGLWSIWRRHSSITRTLLLVGFFFAPVPIILALPEAPQYATARDLLVVPFGLLIGVAGVEWLVTEHGRTGRILAALLILSMPVQFLFFARDYFADYQSRSGYRLDSANMRAVAAYVIDVDRSAPVPAVYLSKDLGTGKSVQWKFHLVKNKREDLWERTQYFDAGTFRPGDVPPGSLMVLDFGNPRLNDLLGPARCSIAHVVNDVANGPSATILRRN